MELKSVVTPHGSPRQTSCRNHTKAFAVTESHRVNVLNHQLDIQRLEITPYEESEAEMRHCQTSLLSTRTV